MRDKIQNLLGRGLPASVVAGAVGCTESYISQLMAEPEFAAGVNARRLAVIETETGRDTALNSLEDTLVDKLEKSMNMLFKPMDILRAFSVVNAAKRRGAESSGLGLGGGTTQVVNVNLPAITIQNFVKNHQGEIVEAGGRSLATLPIASLKAMLPPGVNKNDSPRIANTETLKTLNVPACVQTAHG